MTWPGGSPRMRQKRGYFIHTVVSYLSALFPYIRCSVVGGGSPAVSDLRHDQSTYGISTQLMMGHADVTDRGNGTAWNGCWLWCSWVPSAVPSPLPHVGPYIECKGEQERRI
ncbi:hypothetical protein GGS21DRAFT_530640 [Xylaria nigripes]|nr:hypothetical protein GGS21DRAFT_530640 [Xylaria nigripes]